MTMIVKHFPADDLMGCTELWVFKAFIQQDVICKIPHGCLDTEGWYFTSATFLE